jgi:hypothetical protein
MSCPHKRRFGWQVSFALMTRGALEVSACRERSAIAVRGEASSSVLVFPPPRGDKPCASADPKALPVQDASALTCP